ncbi:hypothetical protein [Bathymodiolus septemdierum thioautotrophic gill symbiont]|nr:hypothetical protein [Bathymodiolus septemdierum thioautotrophic gill symbiont]
MKIKILLIMSALLSSCVLDSFNDTIETGANATKTVATGIAIKKTGDAIKILAKSNIKKQENNALRIKTDATALQTAVAILFSIESEKDRIALAKKLLEAKSKKTLQENLTKRAEHQSNRYFWSILGVLIGFILSVVLKSFSSTLNKVNADIKFNH